MTDPAGLPVAIVGAGPVGLAAAAHLALRRQSMIVFEAGSTAGHSVLEWGHVRMFSPWRYNVDTAAKTMLSASAWTEPNGDECPTGHALVTRYLEPLAALPGIRPGIRLNTTVVGVTREGHDRVKSGRRDHMPFCLRTRDIAGVESNILARAVVDASGTWGTPNPAGVNGINAIGETAASSVIRYGMPDILGRDRARYAGKRVLVLGSGHSALNALLDLATLKYESRDTTILWALRTESKGATFGTGTADELPARAALGARASRLTAEVPIEIWAPFHVQRISHDDNGWLHVEGRHNGEGAILHVNEMIAATGFRPDLSLLSEIRTALDPRLECAERLGTIVDPDAHCCDTVPAHGAAELRHPERDFYIVGMKSYGRAANFLLKTGYGQVQSVVRELSNPHDDTARNASREPVTSACTQPPVLSCIPANAKCCTPAQAMRAGLSCPTTLGRQHP